ncbi:MAG: DMT family transporter [candidate division WWE3 bacterium]|nr:DMT family transporter [candidate division WWE3 bacterium]
MSKPRLLAYLALLATAVIWGAAGPVIKFTLGGVSALNFLTYRFALSALIALALAPFGGLKLPKAKKPLALAILYGFLTSTVALGLLFLGLERTTVLDMTLLAVVGPLLIVGAGEVIFHERVTKREKLGIMIALSGTALTILEPIIRNGAALEQLAGNFLIVLYLIVSTASAVLVKDLMKMGVSALSLTNFSFIVGFFTILPLTIFGGDLPHLISTITNLTLPYHAGVIFMSLLSGTLAYTLWARAQKTIEIGEAAIFSYLYPVFSAPLAVWWLKEKVTLPFVVGAVIIATGVLIAEYKGRRCRVYAH